MGHIKKQAEESFRTALTPTCPPRSVDNSTKANSTAPDTPAKMPLAGVMILRLDEIYGARKGKNWEDQDRLVPQLVHNAIRGTTITIHEDWDAPHSANLLHIDDAIRALLRAVKFFEKKSLEAFFVDPNRERDAACELMTLNIEGHKTQNEDNSLNSVVQKIMKLTHSLSTLFVLPPIKQAILKDEPPLDFASASSVLEFVPKVLSPKI